MCGSWTWPCLHLEDESGGRARGLLGWVLPLHPDGGLQMPKLLGPEEKESH